MIQVQFCLYFKLIQKYIISYLIIKNVYAIYLNASSTTCIIWETFNVSIWVLFDGKYLFGLFLINVWPNLNAAVENSIDIAGLI